MIGEILTPAPKETVFPEWIKFPVLSKRQKEILGLLARGFKRRDVGMSLGITENTIRVHIRLANAKFGVNESIQSALFALETNQLDTSEVTEGFNLKVFDNLPQDTIKVLTELIRVRGMSIATNNQVAKRLGNSKTGKDVSRDLSEARKEIGATNRIQLAALFWTHLQLKGEKIELDTSHLGERVPLSTEELKTINLLAMGFTEKQIAKQLNKSPNTVYQQCLTIRTKLRVKNNAHAVFVAALGNL